MFESFSRESKMRKEIIIGILYTLALAIPFTALAMGILIFFNDLLPDMMRSINLPNIDWRGLTVEGSSRWPEIAGMIIGQLVILALIPISRRLSQMRQRS
jgi:ABC-type Fe3+ transport system permease subunit